MIARITNFASKENQIIDWDNDLYLIASNNLINCEENGEKYYSDCYKEALEGLLEQLDLLLQKYPDALNEEIVLKKASALMKYVKRKGFTLNNCYSYFNEEKRKIDVPCDIKKRAYGIRTLYDRWDNLLVNITGYDLTASGIIYNKNQLNSKYMYGRLTNFKMVHKNCCGSYVFDEETLTYLEPKIKNLTRHL